MTGTKQQYRDFCQKEKGIPIFLTYEWLNIILDENEWDVALLIKGGELAAALPFHFKGKGSKKRIQMPHLTPYMGIWINYPEGQKETTRLSYEKEVIDALLQQVGSYQFFNQKLLPQYMNGLPFYWNGFSQSIRYTYVLNNLDDLESVYKGIQQNIRSQIRKAEDTIEVSESEQIAQLYKLKKKAYEQTNTKLPIAQHYIECIFKACKKNQNGKLLCAKDKNGNTHAMVFLVWDERFCYYLFGASDPAYKNTGAMSLLMWKSIQFSASLNLSYNFEGSMIQSIERFFRSFGATQTPYLQIEKINSLKYRAYSGLKSLIQRNN